MRISDWSLDVCSSDLPADRRRRHGRPLSHAPRPCAVAGRPARRRACGGGQRLGADPGRQLPLRAEVRGRARDGGRSEEHTSELQSLMRISYAVFCLKKKKHRKEEISFKISALIK